MKKMTLSILFLGLGFFMFGTVNAQTQKSAKYSTFKNWKSTEPGMQSDSRVANFENDLRANDPYVWSDPVYVVNIDGKGYILNGHHRVLAAKNISWSGNLPYWDVPQSKISQYSGFSNAAEVKAAAGG